MTEMIESMLYAAGWHHDTIKSIFSRE
jgi:hypothetical protein